jgi:two-component system, LytTR family, sensor kinase
LALTCNPSARKRYAPDDASYLDIESLRLGNRLILEQAIDCGLAEALIPPFSLQPLVENAVQHGLQSSPKARCLRLAGRRRVGEWFDLSVSDDGQSLPSTEIEQIFLAERPRVHALRLLRRRLQALFGRSFKLEVHSEIGKGTKVTMRIPLQT